MVTIVVTGENTKAGHEVPLGHANDGIFAGIVFQEEVAWLHRNSPGTLKNIEKGQESMLAALRHEFSLPIVPASATGLTVCVSLQSFVKNPTQFQEGKASRMKMLDNARPVSSTAMNCACLVSSGH